MIARVWRGLTPESKGQEYFDYLVRTGIKEYRSIQGNRGVYVLRRTHEGRTEYLFISLWDSVDAVRKFAGPDIEKAVYYPEDEEFLLELEPNVIHYDVLMQPE